MKNALLWFIGTLVVIAVFADGGLEVSPTVSPEFSPQFDFSPNLNYAPDRSVTTIESQTNIGTNVEHQTVIVQPLTPSYQWNGQTGLSATTVDPPYRECDPLPGETIYEGPDGRGGCKVVDSLGNRFFINPVGSRWPLGGDNTLKEAVERLRATQGQPLQPQQADLTLDQLQAAFLRNGGSLPFLWDFQSEQSQIDWLKEQPESWK
jgi:hypothetical protein